MVFIDGQRRWTVNVEPGTTLLEAAHAVDAPVHTLCHGIGACIQCKVHVDPGHAGALSAPNELERQRLGTVFHLTGERLSCQARVADDIEVTVQPVRVRKSRRRGGPPRTHVPKPSR